MEETNQESQIHPSTSASSDKPPTDEERLEKGTGEGGEDQVGFGGEEKHSKQDLRVCGLQCVAP